MMHESMTAGAARAVQAAAALAANRGSGLVEPLDLLAALLHESESRAAVLLHSLGFDQAKLPPAVAAIFRISEAKEPADRAAAPPSAALETQHADELKAVLREATGAARAFDRSRVVGTEHLLGSLVALGFAVEPLAAAGVDLEGLRGALDERIETDDSPIPLPSEMPPLELADPSEAVDFARILDASANRAQEGLRVADDYIRFVLNDPFLGKRMKDVRVRLARAVEGLDAFLLIGSRDTAGDVGARVMTSPANPRANTRELLTANFKRAAEALRSLEEYSKLIDTWLAGRFEVLRYDTYVLEKATLEAMRSHTSLGEARLCVLLGGEATLGDLVWLAGEALAGGADVIQYREKRLPDRELLSRARELRIITAKAGARFIVNDRPDLARLAGADGAHLGQTDVRLRDARRIAGPAAILGVSCHTPEQIDEAILAGAGYLGIGPVFQSETKSFDELAGLELVRTAAQATTLPWFAIGGIDEDNIDLALDAGASRIAVASAVTRAERPRALARALKDKLDSAGIRPP